MVIWAGSVPGRAAGLKADPGAAVVRLWLDEKETNLRSEVHFFFFKLNLKFIQHYNKFVSRSSSGCKSFQKLTYQCRQQ